MGQLVLFVLMWGAVWTEEYGIGGIPQYGAGDYSDPLAGLPPLDYTGHSIDAPTPLDYKYVEDSNANPDTQNSKYSKDEITDRWQKPKKSIPNRLEKDEGDDVEQAHFIKHRSNHRPRHRPRMKKSRSNEPQRRRRVITDLPPDDNIDDDTYQYRDDVKQEPRNVVEHIHKTTTEKIVRRKPRDRRLEYSDKRSDLEDDEFVDLDSKIKDVEKFVPEIPHVNSLRRGRPPPPPDDNESEDENLGLKPQTKGPRRKPEKNNRDYNEYYDMNRVYNIKNRLPLLIRRSSTEMPVPPEDPYGPSKKLMDILASARRAGDGADPDIMVRPTLPEDTADDVTETLATEVETTSTSISTKLPIKLVTEAPISTTSQIVSTTYMPSDTLLTEVIPRDLSLAEKSRLSILKKAQKKEKDKPLLITKPPILLRFTNKLNTVVMIEPTNRDPFMRAKLVSNDSPEQLEKVKRLMRNKIVSEAKDISDLTNNWNDMVCEYIDTSLLESRSSEDKVNLLLLMVVTLLNIFM